MRGRMDHHVVEMSMYRVGDPAIVLKHVWRIVKAHFIEGQFTI